MIVSERRRGAGGYYLQEWGTTTADDRPLRRTHSDAFGPESCVVALLIPLSTGVLGLLICCCRAEKRKNLPLWQTAKCHIAYSTETLC